MLSLYVRTLSCQEDKRSRPPRKEQTAGPPFRENSRAGSISQASSGSKYGSRTAAPDRGRHTSVCRLRCYVRNAPREADGTRSVPATLGAAKGRTRGAPKLLRKLRRTFNR
jgi:hypothetical protein